MADDASADEVPMLGRPSDVCPAQILVCELKLKCVANDGSMQATKKGRPI